MKRAAFASLALSGLKAMIQPQRTPVLATIILTDRCNLNCLHCAVSNQNHTFSTYAEAVVLMRRLKQGAPVMNLPAGLDHYLSGDWNRPCRQCVVYENGRAFTCGRCSELPGLCRECGYLFAVEFALLLKGNLRAIREMLQIYLKYC